MVNCALAWLPRLSETVFVRVPRCVALTMTLMWATLLAWIVPRSQEMTGWSAMGLHCPWLEFAEMYVTPAGSCSLTVTFRTRLFEGLYSVMRKSIFVPIGIALAGLG